MFSHIQYQLKTHLFPFWANIPMLILPWLTGTLLIPLPSLACAWTGSDSHAPF